MSGAEPPSRSRGRRRPNAVVAGLALALLAGVGAAAAGESWAWGRGLVLTRGAGWGALGALALALGATPIGRLGRALGRRWRVAPARRTLGLAAAALATLHAGAALWGPLAGAWDALFGWPHLRAGALALAVLLALALTSFPRAVKALRVRHWKALHRLAYGAAGLAFVHVLLGPFAPRRWTLGLLGALLVVQLFRALPERPRGETAPSA